MCRSGPSWSSKPFKKPFDQYTMKGIDLLRSSPKVMEWLLRDSLEEEIISLGDLPV
jgi:hypothetical protein